MMQVIAEDLVDPKRKGPSLPVGEAARHSSLFLTGDFLDPLEEISANFKSLAAQSDSGFVIQVLDPAEINLPYGGRVLFETPEESKQRELINNVASIRTEYNKRIIAHIDGVRKIAHECEWHHVLHSTDRNIADTLLDVWTTLTIHTSRTGVLRR
jgi:hypothetical protein